MTPRCALLRRHRQQPRERAANLERAGVLEVLELQHQLAAGHLARAARSARSASAERTAGCAQPRSRPAGGRSSGLPIRSWLRWWSLTPPEGECGSCTRGARLVASQAGVGAFKPWTAVDTLRHRVLHADARPYFCHFVTFVRGGYVCAAPALWTRTQRPGEPMHVTDRTESARCWPAASAKLAV